MKKVPLTTLLELVLKIAIEYECSRCF